MPAPARTPSARGARIAAVVVLGILGLFLVIQGGSDGQTAVVSVRDEAAAEPTDPDQMAFVGTPPSADVAALLNGLSIGNEFDGWKVNHFNPTKEKIVWIEFGKDRAFFSVGIGVKGSGKPSPPVQTDLYEIGYGLQRPRNASIPEDVKMRLVEQVASRIRMREKEVPKPTAL